MLIESFHSGSHGQRRYCSLHRPLTRLVRSTGVVLCYPLGHEYYRAHRSYVKLADQLARLGFPVMRFDYFGSGDSEGECGHERLEDWLHEIAEVVEELRSREPVSGIALGGMRFGATLSLLAAQRIDSVRALMLWDPLAEGSRYIDELQHLHGRLLNDLERFARPRRAEDCSEGEFIGTRYGSRFLRELAALRPDALCTIDDTDIVLVGTRGTDHCEALTDGLRKHARLHAVATSRDYGWQDVHRIGETIMDPDAVRHLTSSLNSVAA